MFMYLRFITFEKITDFKHQPANGTAGSPSEQLMKHQQTMHFVHLRTLVFILRTGRTRLGMHNGTSACKSATFRTETFMHHFVCRSCFRNCDCGGFIANHMFFCFQSLIVIDKKQKQTKKKKKRIQP